MLRIAAEAISRALGGSAGEIFRHREGRFESAAAFGDTAEATSILSALAHSDVADATFAGRPALAAVSRYRQQINGAIVVWRPAEDAAWSKDDHFLIEAVAGQIGIANEQIANHERILALSRTDALTGLFNRRAFFEELSRRFARLARDQKPAALIYIDLDNFKAVNDRHGHKRGDEALLAVRDMMMQHTRPIDLIARLGGDEFALWLEGADEAIAVKRCQDIIAAADSLRQFSGSDETPLTLSLGVAIHVPDQLETLDALLQRADEAMYGVKHDGKCNYRLAPSPADVPAGEKTP
jgi:diguanylate cyclase (GGDEF)-like protein